MADYLFVDVRRFAVPPGRPVGGERFERRPPRRLLASLLWRWLDRWRGSEGDPFTVPSYLPGDWR